MKRWISGWAAWVGLAMLSSAGAGEVHINSHPAQVRAGRGASIRVSWSGLDPAINSIGLKISSDPAIPGTSGLVERQFKIFAASGTQIFSLPLPLTAPASGFYIYAFAAKNGLWDPGTPQDPTPQDRTLDNAIVTVPNVASRLVYYTQVGGVPKVTYASGQYPRAFSVGRGWIVTLMGGALTFVADQTQPPQTVYRSKYDYDGLGQSIFTIAYAPLNGAARSVSVGSGWITLDSSMNPFFIRNPCAAAQAIHYGLLDFSPGNYSQAISANPIMIGGVTRSVSPGLGWIEHQGGEFFMFVRDPSRPPQNVYYGEHDFLGFTHVDQWKLACSFSAADMTNAIALGSGWIENKEYAPRVFRYLRSPSRPSANVYRGKHRYANTTGYTGAVGYSMTDVDDLPGDPDPLLMGEGWIDQMQDDLLMFTPNLGHSPASVFTYASGLDQYYSLTNPPGSGAQSVGIGWPTYAPDNWISIVGSSVTINSYPLRAVAGSTVAINVSWKGADPSQYKVFLKVSNYVPGAAPAAGKNLIWQEESFPITSNAGTATFNLKLPGSTPGGKAYILAFIGHKDTGWNGRLHEFRTADDVITIVEPAWLSINSYPATVATGGVAPVHVTWSGVDTALYDLGIAISSSPTSSPTAEQIFNLSACRSEQTFNVNVPSSSAAQQAYVYAYVKRKNQGVQSRLTDARSPDNSINVIRNLTINSTPWPYAVAGNNANINVSWNLVAPPAYSLLLRITNVTGSVKLEQTFPMSANAGMQDFQVPVPPNTPPSSCHVVAILKRNSDGIILAQVRTADNSLPIVLPPSTLQISAFPTQAIAGTEMPVSVSWNGVNTATHNLFLRLSNLPLLPGEELLLAEETFDLPSQSGFGTTFDLTLPTYLRAGKCYIEGFIKPKSSVTPTSTPDAKTLDEVVTIIPMLELITFSTVMEAGGSGLVRFQWYNIDTSSYNLVVKVSNEPITAGEELIKVEGAYELPTQTGSQSFLHPLPIDTRGGSAYIYAYLNHKAQGWNGKLTQLTTAEDALTVVPKLKINTYPPQATAGTSVPISMSWNSVSISSYNLVLAVSNGVRSYEATFELPPNPYPPTISSGMQTFNVPLPANATLGGHYIYAYLSHKPNGWNQKLIDLRSPDNAVTITAP